MYTDPFEKEGIYIYLVTQAKRTSVLLYPDKLRYHIVYIMNIKRNIDRVFLTILSSNFNNFTYFDFLLYIVV